MSNAVVDRRELVALEKKVDQFRGAAWEMAEALAEIRERGLYKITHESWEEYTRDRFGLAPSTCHNLILAVATRDELSQSLSAPRDLPPATISEVSRVPAQARPEVLEMATVAASEQGKDRPSSRDVRAAAKQYRKRVAPKPTRAQEAGQYVTRFHKNCEGTISSLRQVLKHAAYIDPAVQESVALAIVSTANELLAMAKERGLIEPQVARGVLHDSVEYVDVEVELV